MPTVAGIDDAGPDVETGSGTQDQRSRLQHDVIVDPLAHLDLQPLRRALEEISEAGQGVVLYLRQSEHGLDLIHQLRTYALMQQRGLSKAEASAETGYGLNRDYGVGAQILHELGLRRILLLTNHPPRVTALEGFELEVVGNIPLGSPAGEESPDRNKLAALPTEP